MPAFNFLRFTFYIARNAAAHSISAEDDASICPICSGLGAINSVQVGIIHS